MALTTNNLFTGLYQDTLRAPDSAPWTAGRANCRGYLGVNEEGGNCGQPDVQYFKTQIVSFIVALTTAAVTARPGGCGFSMPCSGTR